MSAPADEPGVSAPAEPGRRAGAAPRRPSGPVVAVALLAGGGGLALLASRPDWDAVRVVRLAPLSGFTVGVPGHTVQPAVTGLGLVALAAVVAVLAVLGRARRLVGAVVLIAGGLLTWRAAAGLRPVSAARARELVGQARPGSALDAAAAFRVHVIPSWPVVAMAGGALVMVGGALVALRAGRWAGLSARYDAPSAGGGRPSRAGPTAGADGGADPALTDPVPGPTGPLDPARTDPARTDLALWQSLDRGEDPTAGG